MAEHKHRFRAGNGQPLIYCYGRQEEPPTCWLSVWEVFDELKAHITELETALQHAAQCWMTNDGCPKCKEARRVLGEIANA